MNKANNYDSLYNDLVQTVNEIRPYYDVDKIKPWSVYIWTKDIDDCDGENVFDIEDGRIVYYVKDHVIPDEVVPIIRKIQSKIRAIRLAWNNDEI